MAFERPTLAELVDRIESDFISRLSLNGAVLRRSLVRVLARVLAGASHMLHGHLDFLSRQLFPDTSEDEFLIRQGLLFGVERTAAEFATGDVDLTGTNGSVIPAGTVLLRSDGAEFVTEDEETISSGTATVTVTASLAGADGNCDEATTLSLESPIAGVDTAGSVASGGIAGGTDQESLEDYRERVLERMRSAPHGGASTDYVAWAKEVAGVTRAWVYPLQLGAGTVVVRFVRDDDASPIPDAGEVEEVQDYIDARRPVTAAVTVVAPVAEPLDVEVSITPDNSATRAAVEAELEDFLQREAEPGGTLLLSQILVAIGTAEGVEDFTLTSPAADVTHTTNQLATLGTVTFT